MKLSHKSVLEFNFICLIAKSHLPPITCIEFVQLTINSDQTGTDINELTPKEDVDTVYKSLLQHFLEKKNLQGKKRLIMGEIDKLHFL